MKLVHKRTLTLELDNSSEAIISKSEGVFENIDSNFTKWELNEVDRKNPEKILQSVNILSFEVEDENKDECMPYLYVKAYPQDLDYYLFHQELIVTFCKKCRDLLIGENRKTFFFSSNHYEIFAVEIRCTFVNEKAELSIRPMRLGDAGILVIPTGGLQIFVIEDGFFSDGTKSSDIWGKIKS